MATQTDLGSIGISLKAGGIGVFTSDVDKAFAKAKASARDFKTAMKQEVRESNASLALMGEEFGIRLPRHVRSFVSSLPGISKAMSAAFGAFAVIAVAEALEKGIQKVKEWSEAAEKRRQEE